MQLHYSSDLVVSLSPHIIVQSFIPDIKHQTDAANANHKPQNPQKGSYSIVYVSEGKKKKVYSSLQELLEWNVTLPWSWLLAIIQVSNTFYSWMSLCMDIIHTVHTRDTHRDFHREKQSLHASRWAFKAWSKIIIFMKEIWMNFVKTNKKNPKNNRVRELSR